MSRTLDMPRYAIDHLGTRAFRHRGPVRALVMPDASSVLTAQGSAFHVWHAEGAWCERQIDEPDGSIIQAMAYDPAHRRIYYTVDLGGGRAPIFAMDLDTGQRTARLDAHKWPPHRLVCSPDGAHLVSLNPTTSPVLWRPGTQEGVLLNAAPADDRPVHAAAFAPDGHTLLTLHGTDADGLLMRWDVATGAHRGTIELCGHDVLTLEPQRGWLATAGCTDDAHVWTLDGRRVRTFKHNTRVRALAFDATRELLLTGEDDGRVHAWSMTSGAHVWSWCEGAAAAPLFALSPDATTLAVSTSHEVTLLETASGEARHDVQGHASGVRRLAFIDRGRHVASFGATDHHNDRHVRIWDAQTLELASSVDVGRARLFSSATMAPRITTDSAGHVAMHDSSDGDVLHRFAWAPTRVLTDLSTDASGRIVITSELERTGHQPCTLMWSTARGVPMRALARGSGLADANLRLSPRGDLLAMFTYTGAVTVLDTRTGDVRYVLHGHTTSLRDALFSEDGQRLVTIDEHGDIVWWTTHDGRREASLSTLRANPSQGALNTNGSLLALCHDGDPAAHLWDLDGKSMLYSFSIEDTHVTAVTFDPDGMQLWTGHDDTSIHAWDPSIVRQSRTTQAMEVTADFSAPPSVFKLHIDDALAAAREDLDHPSAIARIWRKTDWATLSPEDHLEPLLDVLDVLEARHRTTEAHILAMAGILRATRWRTLHEGTPTGPISGAALDPTGRYLCTVSPDRGAGLGAVVRTWSLRSGRCVHVIEGILGDLGDATPRARGTAHVQWTPDARRVTVGWRGHGIALIDPFRGAPHPSLGLFASDGASHVSSWTHDPAGRGMAISAQLAREDFGQDAMLPVGLFQLDGARLIARRLLEAPGVHTRHDPFTHIVWREDDTLALFDDVSGDLDVRERTTGALVVHLDAPGASMDPTGHTLAALDDAGVTLTTLTSPPSSMHLAQNTPSAVTWSPDGRSLAVHGTREITLVDAQTGTTWATLKTEDHVVVFGQGRSHVVTGTLGGSMTLWRGGAAHPLDVHPDWQGAVMGHDDARLVLWGPGGVETWRLEATPERMHMAWSNALAPWQTSEAEVAATHPLRAPGVDASLWSSHDEAMMLCDADGMRPVMVMERGLIVCPDSVRPELDGVAHFVVEDRWTFPLSWGAETTLVDICPTFRDALGSIRLPSQLPEALIQKWRGDAHVPHKAVHTRSLPDLADVRVAVTGRFAFLDGQDTVRDILARLGAVHVDDPEDAELVACGDGLDDLSRMTLHAMRVKLVDELTLRDWLELLEAP